ncbi:hypothetical protein MMC28_004438 [Mycoblastus sanguinarius]|nr:hypothetical protein [Mycoblastus sanguinarius]
MTALKTIFIIGGTGAQGTPIIKALAAPGSGYAVKILTRDVTSARAKLLTSLPNVTLAAGTFASETALRDGFTGAWGAFVNIDGFNCGEKAELYWGIRSYELALECGVQFFVWGNLDFGLKKSGYDPKFRSGHYDGKGRVGEWIMTQNKAIQSAKMGAAIFTSGPYIEMTIAGRTVMTPAVEDGVLTWRVPLGEGAVCHTALEDCGHYVKWLFDNREKANGLDLEVGIAHIGYHELADAFTKVTGKPARFVDVSLEEYWSAAGLAGMAEGPAGYNADPSDPATMSFKDNFTGFWNVWKFSGGNEGVVRRDYALLDEIHPGRIKSAEEWFRKEDESGRQQGLGSLWDRVQSANLKHVLKITEDGRKGKI